MAKIKTELSKSEIEAKKEAFKQKLNDSINNSKVGKSSPAKTFLLEIQELIKKAIDNGVSYKQLSKDILDVYNFKVSEQTIRAFAQTVLGIKKQKRSKSVEDKVNNTTTTVDGRVKSNFDDI